MLNLPPTLFKPTPVAQLALRLALGWLVFLLGWGWLASQHSLLWQRLPGTAPHRYAADALTTPLPSAMKRKELLQWLCPQTDAQPVWQALLQPPQSQCLALWQPGADSGAPKFTAEQTRTAWSRFEQVLDAQVTSVTQWQADASSGLADKRVELAMQLAQIQSANPATSNHALAALARWVPGWFGSGFGALREPVGREAVSRDVATEVQRFDRATQIARIQLAQARDPAMRRAPTDEQLRDLGLAAAGLKLAVDYGQYPARVSLASDRQSLADQLEWQRRAQQHTAQGFDLNRLHGLGKTLLVSSVLFVLIVMACGGSVAIWSLATVLLGTGALLLTDLALTGDPALRYLAHRQFVVFSAGGVPVDLTLQVPMPAFLGLGSPLTLWWPLLGVAMGVVALRLVRRGTLWAWAPLRAWVGWGDSPLKNGLQMALLVLVGSAAAFALALPATASESLIALGCLGVSTYWARQTAYANTGAGIQWNTLLVVACALGLALVLSVLRADFGHALVAAALGLCFAWLFGARGLRTGVLVLGVATAIVLAWSVAQGELVEPLQWLASVLPAHAAERLQSMVDPFSANSSDLARTRWLMHSGGLWGWGPGYVPWQGLSPARLADGLPLQGPSDYVVSLSTAVWGSAGGVGLFAGVCTVFLTGAIQAARTSLRPGMSEPVRLLAAFGFCGCVAMLVKAMLSLGGVVGWLPLTGLPVALLGYGPISTLAGLLYLMLALGLPHAQPQHAASATVNVRAQQIARGRVGERGRALGALVWSALVVCWLGSVWLLQRPLNADEQSHTAKLRQQLTQTLINNVNAAEKKDEKALTQACPHLGAVAKAWQAKLQSQPLVSKDASADGALRLNVVGVARDLGVLDTSRRCAALARELGAALSSPQQLANPVVSVDYATRNAWWGLPGCVRTSATGRDGKTLPKETCLPGEDAPGLPSSIPLDPWISAELALRLRASTRQAVGQQQVNHRTVPVGPLLNLSLNERIQSLAQTISSCFAGKQSGTACEAVLPRDEAWQKKHFAPGQVRAGAIGITVAEVDSGRVVALAGALSDCSAAMLRARAQANEEGPLTALPASSIQPCAQVPDARSAYLLGYSPALWMVSPGSSYKPWAILAGIDSGLVPAAEDGRWLRILAESEDYVSIQRLALDSGATYLRTMRQASWQTGCVDLLWGISPLECNKKATPKSSPIDTMQATQALQNTWRNELVQGHEKLVVTGLKAAQVQTMRREKESGVNIDKLYGNATVTRYLQARALADASVGGGDVRTNTLGLVNAWRLLDLRARGEQQAPGLHLLESQMQASSSVALNAYSTQAARRVLGMTTGITASLHKGTAQGSCRRVMGQCPATGWPALWGKTGTGDFLVADNSPFVKANSQIPSKLFGGVFELNGTRYAIGVMATRVRDGAKSNTLELTSSAPAEAALTLLRELSKPQNLTFAAPARP
ncbi:MAG: FtsW/RodA/SpoVE family cell cycle protein [Candidatus Saccharibacteria bacterium]|nr:FtsW/RodA/SpoVE family cell cycle protein [Rhodoferax sp.]